MRVDRVIGVRWRIGFIWVIGVVRVMRFSGMIGVTNAIRVVIVVRDMFCGKTSSHLMVYVRGVFYGNSSFSSLITLRTQMTLTTITILVTLMGMGRFRENSTN